MFPTHSFFPSLFPLGPSLFCARRLVARLLGTCRPQVILIAWRSCGFQVTAGFLLPSLFLPVSQTPVTLANSGAHGLRAGPQSPHGPWAKHNFRCSTACHTPGNRHLPSLAPGPQVSFHGLAVCHSSWLRCPPFLVNVPGSKIHGSSPCGHDSS